MDSLKIMKKTTQKKDRTKNNHIMPRRSNAKLSCQTAMGGMFSDGSIFENKSHDTVVEIVVGSFLLL